MSHVFYSAVAEYIDDVKIYYISVSVEEMVFKFSSCLLLFIEQTITNTANHHSNEISLCLQSISIK